MGFHQMCFVVDRCFLGEIYTWCLVDLKHSSYKAFCIPLNAPSGKHSNLFLTILNSRLLLANSLVLIEFFFFRHEVVTLALF